VSRPLPLPGEPFYSRSSQRKRRGVEREGVYPRWGAVLLNGRRPELVRRFIHRSAWKRMILKSTHGPGPTSTGVPG
jgi:hypothetical protein